MEPIASTKCVGVPAVPPDSTEADAECDAADPSDPAADRPNPLSTVATLSGNIDDF
jgi:hypothetical protein